MVHYTISSQNNHVTYSGSSGSPQNMDGEYGTYQRIIDMETYDGETTVTPSEYTQILETANKAVLENITINPIPSNYGRIAWNGRNLLVF